MGQKDKKEKKSFLDIVTRLISIFFVIVAIGSLVRTINRVMLSESRIGAAEERLGEVKREQAELLKQLEFVQSDFFQDQMARDQLGLARESEIVVVLPDDDIVRRLSPRKMEQEESPQTEPNWRKWRNLFF